jgi:1,4-alpha-glucan branching enzyme
MPLSHDEVVHGKGALLHKMPGDPWQQFANLRLLYAYQYLRPGKKLLFMGAEFAPDTEWNHDTSLPWHQDAQPLRQGLRTFLQALGSLYQRTAALWQDDGSPAGFFWVDHSDQAQSILAFVRQTQVEGAWQHLVVVLNFTPVPRPGYRIGVPTSGSYDICLSSDDAAFGGSATANHPRLHTEALPWHGQQHSLVVTLPPLGAVVLLPTPTAP